MIKQLLITCCIAAGAVQCKKNPEPPAPVESCMSNAEVNNTIVPAASLINIFNNYTANGLPGITFVAKKGNSFWQYNSGKSNIENNDAMEACMIWPAYSISKMYTATCILRMREEGRISLDQKINTCLPPAVVSQVPDAARISIRMLLNHSSGIENFWENAAFVGRYIQDPSKPLGLADYLEASQERLFEPGTDVAYSNSNYLLLALIIDHVTGKDHAKVYQQYVWQPLLQQDNYYRNLPASRLNKMPKLYADVDASGTLTDYTALSLIQFMNEAGSNSIMSTPKNFVSFMDAIAHNRILSAASSLEMKTWFKGSGNDGYGLGLELFEVNGKELYGHSGSSFGGRTLLLYNPQTDISFFIGVNAGDEIGGPVLEKISNLMNEVLAVMSA